MTDKLINIKYDFQLFISQNTMYDAVFVLNFGQTLSISDCGICRVLAKTETREPQVSYSIHLAYTHICQETQVFRI